MPTVRTTRQVELHFSHQVPDGLTTDEANAYVEVAEAVALIETFPRRNVNVVAESFKEIGERHGLTEQRMHKLMDLPGKMSTVTGTLAPGQAVAHPEAR